MLKLGSETFVRALQRREPEEEQERASIVVLTTAELAECTCPEFCERDHDVD